MITSNYNHKEDILETNFSGDINLEQILEYISFSSFDKEHPGVLKIISDCRNANFKISPDDIPTIAKATENILQYHPYIIDAIILANPYETALSFLYQKIKPIRKYIFEIFASRENGLEWLKNYEGMGRGIGNRN